MLTECTVGSELVLYFVWANFRSDQYAEVAHAELGLKLSLLATRFTIFWDVLGILCLRDPWIRGNYMYDISLSIN